MNVALIPRLKIMTRCAWHMLWTLPASWLIIQATEKIRRRNTIRVSNCIWCLMTLPSTTMDGMTGIMQVVPDVIMTTYIWVKITITVSPIIRKKLYTGVKTGQSVLLHACNSSAKISWKAARWIVGKRTIICNGMTPTTVFWKRKDSTKPSPQWMTWRVLWEMFLSIIREGS